MMVLFKHTHCLDIIDKTNDPFRLGGILKQFLSELKEPLVPWIILETIMSKFQINPDMVPKELQTAIQILSPSHQKLLFRLLSHLSKVEKFKQFNKMDQHNLSILFGMGITRAEDKLTDALAKRQQKFLAILLENVDFILPPKKPSRKAPNIPEISQIQQDSTESLARSNSMKGEAEGRKSLHSRSNSFSVGGIRNPFKRSSSKSRPKSVFKEPNQQKSTQQKNMDKDVNQMELLLPSLGL